MIVQVKLKFNAVYLIAVQASDSKLYFPSIAAGYIESYIVNLVVFFSLLVIFLHTH
jgi:hypothetical protein